MSPPLNPLKPPIFCYMPPMREPKPLNPPPPNMEEEEELLNPPPIKSEEEVEPSQFPPN